jgi:hypothetical protein
MPNQKSKDDGKKGTSGLQQIPDLEGKKGGKADALTVGDIFRVLLLSVLGVHDIIEI